MVERRLWPTILFDIDAGLLVVVGIQDPHRRHVAGRLLFANHWGIPQPVCRSDPDDNVSLECCDGRWARATGHLCLDARKDEGCV